MPWGGWERGGARRWWLWLGRTGIHPRLDTHLHWEQRACAERTHRHTHAKPAQANANCHLPTPHTHTDTVDTIWIVTFGKLLLISLHTNAPFNLLTLLSINYFKITLKLFIFYLCLQEIENPFRLLLLLRCCGWQTQLKLETHTERKRESQHNWPEREQSRERQQRRKVKVREGKRTPLSSWERRIASFVPVRVSFPLLRISFMVLWWNVGGFCRRVVVVLESLLLLLLSCSFDSPLSVLSLCWGCEWTQKSYKQLQL